MALQRRGILTHPSSCSRCGEPETAEHLFFHCRHARRVWDKLQTTVPFDTQDLTTFAHALEKSTSLTCLPPTGVIIDIFPWVCWCVWTARNQLVFENRTLDPSTIASNAVRLAREWQEAQTRTQPARSNMKTFNLNTSTGFNTLYTDAAWRAHDRTAGCGWILHDPQQSEIKQGSSTELFVANPLMAEALAVREALLQAKTLHLSNICIKSDNQVLIKALNSKHHPVELYGINLDIEHLSLAFSFVSFVYVPRAQNSAADALAKAALYSVNLI